jgi:hypothetical protein
MCELLLAARTRGTDPGDVQIGTVIHIGEDGHGWGREESRSQWVVEGNDPAAWPGAGKFVLVRIPGVAASRAEQLLEHQFTDDSGNATFYPDGVTPLPFRRRAWRVLVASLPAGILQSFQDNGEVTVTVAQVRNFIQRVLDSAVYTGFD